MKQLITIILIFLSINIYSQTKRDHVMMYNHITGTISIDNTVIDKDIIKVDRTIDDVIKFTFDSALFTFEPMFYDFTYDILENRGKTYTFYSGSLSEYMQNYDILVFKIKYVHNPKYLE